MSIAQGCTEHDEKEKLECTDGLSGRKDRNKVVKDHSEVAKDHKNQETKKMKHDVNANGEDCAKKGQSIRTSYGAWKLYLR